jgi:hypothetical protein
MHTSFALTPEGLSLGLLDQKIHSSAPMVDDIKELKKKSHNKTLAIYDKESMRWLDSLRNSKNTLELTNVQLVTVCDREADMYDFFAYSNRLNSPVFVRARQDRRINLSSHYSEKMKDKLWSTIQGLHVRGNMNVEIPARDNKAARTALLDLRFGSFLMTPSKNNARCKTEKLLSLKLQAIYVIESNPSVGKDPLEWMLLTNLAIDNFDQALEKVQWYCIV